MMNGTRTQAVLAVGLALWGVACTTSDPGNAPPGNDGATTAGAGANATGSGGDGSAAGAAGGGGAGGGVGGGATLPGRFDPGDPDFYDDFSGDSIARDDSGETKTAWATARGYNTLVDAAGDIAQAGWIYTVEPTDVPGHVGTFPFPSQRGVILEGHPQIGSDPNQRQTDYYLELGDIPPRHAVQFWMYLIDADAMPSTFGAGNKFFYYADEYPGGFFLVNMGFRSFEHQDPSYSLLERTAFESGDVPHNEAYWDVAAHGPTGTNGEDGRMINTECVEGTFPDLYQNVSKKHLVPNTWTLFKLVVDMTQANGVLEMYMRERGERDFTLIMQSPATGVTWPTDPSLHPLMARLRIPTVENAYPLHATEGTGSGRNWKVLAELAWAADEADLPTYAE
jgi:hypothetical protein